MSWVLSPASTWSTNIFKLNAPSVDAGLVIVSPCTSTTLCFTSFSMSLITIRTLAVTLYKS